MEFLCENLSDDRNGKDDGKDATTDKIAEIQ
jgi:hypothetical protein